MFRFADGTEEVLVEPLRKDSVVQAQILQQAV